MNCSIGYNILICLIKKKFIAICSSTTIHSWPVFPASLVLPLLPPPSRHTRTSLSSAGRGGVLL